MLLYSFYGYSTAWCMYVILHSIHMRFVLASSFSVLRALLFRLYGGKFSPYLPKQQRDNVIYVYFIWRCFFLCSLSLCFARVYLHGFYVILLLLYTGHHFHSRTKLFFCQLQLLYSVYSFQFTPNLRFPTYIIYCYTFAKIVACVFFLR